MDKYKPVVTVELVDAETPIEGKFKAANITIEYDNGTIMSVWTYPESIEAIVDELNNWISENPNAGGAPR